VVFNSDAIGLTEKKRRRLIECGLDELRVSMDAASTETYQAIRGVPAFTKVVENVTGLVRLRQTLQAAAPRVSLWFTTVRRNVHELSDFIRLAAQIGAGGVNLQRLVYYGEGLAVEGKTLHGATTSREEEYLAEATRLAKEWGGRAGLREHDAGVQSQAGRAPAALDPQLHHRQWQRPAVLHLPVDDEELSRADPRECPPARVRGHLERRTIPGVPGRV